MERKNQERQEGRAVGVSRCPENPVPAGSWLCGGRGPGENSSHPCHDPITQLDKARCLWQLSLHLYQHQEHDRFCLAAWTPGATPGVADTRRECSTCPSGPRSLQCEHFQAVSPQGCGGLLGLCLFFMRLYLGEACTGAKRHCDK